MSNMKRHDQADPAIVEITYNEHGLPAGIEDMDEAGLQALADNLNAKLLNRKNLPPAPAFEPTDQNLKAALDAEIAAHKKNQNAGAALTADQLAAAAERLHAEHQAVVAIETVRPETMPATILHSYPAVRRPAPLAVPRITEIEGFENYRPDDLLTPRLKIIQAMTRGVDDAYVGHFYNTLNKKISKEATLVFLRWTRTRAKFEKGNFTPQGLQCCSDNGDWPAERIRSPFTNACDECEMSKWGPDGVRPPCQEGRTFLALDTKDDNQPVTFTCAGTALKEARRLISTLGFRHKPLFFYEIRIVTEKMETDKGKWYLPVLLPQPVTDPARIAEFREMYTALRSMEITIDDESINEQSQA